MARNRHTNASASAYEALTYDPAGNEVRQFLMDGIWEGLWLEEVGLMLEPSAFAVLPRGTVCHAIGRGRRNPPSEERMQGTRGYG